jgi:hypothetical protein
MSPERDLKESPTEKAKPVTRRPRASRAGNGAGRRRTTASRQEENDSIAPDDAKAGNSGPISLSPPPKVPVLVPSLDEESVPESTPVTKSEEPQTELAFGRTRSRKGKHTSSSDSATAKETVPATAESEETAAQDLESLSFGRGKRKKTK